MALHYSEVCKISGMPEAEYETGWGPKSRATSGTSEAEDLQNLG